MSLIETSLNAVNTTGPGTAVVPDEPAMFCTAQTIISGVNGGTPPTITIEYSLDNVNFGTVGSVGSSNGDYITNISALSSSTGGPFVAVRAHYTNLGNSNPAPTVTVILAVS